MTSIAKMVYIDTNVFVYQLLTSHDPSYQNKAKKTQKFFKDIEDGKFQAITSTFTETEYRGVVKKIISSSKKRSITSLEEFTAMKDFNNFNIGMGIALIDADVISKNRNTSNVDIFSFAGRTVEHHAVPIPPNKPNPQKNERWKCIGGADAILVNLAIRAGADMIATFDTGFKGLNHTGIQPLLIPDFYTI